MNTEQQTNNQEEIIKTGRPGRPTVKRASLSGEPEAVLGLRPIRDRTRRKPLYEHSLRAVGSVNKDPNFHYHIFADRKDRIKNALEAGYEFVEDTVGGSLKDSIPSQIGSVASQSLGNNTKGYFMRIPMELHLEDLKRKEKLNDTSAKDAYNAGKSRLGNGRGYGDINIETASGKSREKHVSLGEDTEQ